MSARSQFIVGGILAIFLVGCGTHAADRLDEPLSEMSAPKRNFHVNWRASLDVLDEYRFEIGRADRRAGLITTEPLLGKHWFEFWRSDAATGEDLWESTLQTIHRVAVVRIQPDPESASGFVVQAEVRTYRSNRPVQEITSTSEAYGMFTTGGRVDEDLSRDGAEDFVELGRDEKLSAELAEQIRLRAARLLVQAGMGPDERAASAEDRTATQPATAPAR